MKESKNTQDSNVITASKFKKTGKSVMLFSSGMDSVIFEKLLNPDILLYIPMKSKYQERETRSINELIEKGFIDGSKLIVLDNVIDLSQFERDDMIVPCRNSMLITLASMYGETIYLNSVQGDRSSDKCPEFFQKQEALLNQMWMEQHWCEGREIKIVDPFKDKTKTELTKMFLEAGGDPEALLVSYSSYEGREKHSGVDKPSVRKYVALVNNDIEIPEDYWEQEPMSAKWIPEVLDLMKEGRYRGKEDFDFIEVFKKRGLFGF